MARTLGVATSKADFDEGAIDNVTIGGTTKGAGSFTTLVATTGVHFNGSAAASASTTVAAILTTILGSGFGFQTSANALAAANAINSIITCLKDHGLMKTD